MRGSESGGAGVVLIWIGKLEVGVLGRRFRADLRDHSAHV